MTARGMADTRRQTLVVPAGTLLAGPLLAGPLLAAVSRAGGHDEVMALLKQQRSTNTIRGLDGAARSFMRFLGLGSGAFMMYTMRYSYIFIPAGVVGVTIGYILFFREKLKCKAMSCRMARKNVNLVLLIFATVMVTIAILLQIFPEFTASLLTGTR